MPTVEQKVKVKIGAKDMLISTRQMETSLNSGVSLLETLNFMAEQGQTENVKALFAGMSAHITKGNSFSSALKACSDSFPKLYVNLVVAAEKTGALPETLAKLADHLEKQDDTRKKIRTYMTYPCIICIVSISTLFFVSLFIMPAFIKAMNIPDDRLPFITKFLMDISGFVSTYWYACLAALAGLIWYAVRMFRTMGENRALDGALLKIPIMGTLIQKICISRFVSSLATLLDKGVPILESLAVAREVTGNSVIALEIDKIYENVRMGFGLTDKIKASPYFPPLVGNMVATGEMTGRLPHMLMKISEFYDKDVDAALRDFFASLEPILILGMGIVVGAIVAGMMLPVLSMTDFVG